ncbi:DUF7151 family protein [Flavobacterium lipolyticum]|uniref:DUF7151 domain-containing protein n=1 Tax=Flavobacterium lipolyticum TaxID=2893754 RepID=A0ABS8LXQ6_9FLAO|nr:hypothetical protein [Flavobacterium sp. F-126]MCC9017330.1 hypothetical protein [Flavobacterium sp. F-126]
MKRIHLLCLIISISFTACEGDEGSQGSNGVNTLVNMSVENPGINCENGGLKIETGLDNNFNGILDGNEVQNTKYVCNGINGKNSLTTVIKEPKGVSCENGGIKINSGLDLNKNGVLEENEITSTAYVCNGTDGNTNLTRTTNENSGGNCGNGGLKVEYGLDLNKDGVLDDNEVKYKTYVCNGLNGNLSLVNITDEAKGGTCGNGGVKIESGIDLNNNKILDNSEIQVTKYVCNGNGGIVFVEVRVSLPTVNPLFVNATTKGIRFDIRDFKDVKSVVLEASPYVGNSNNYALVELYNITDGKVIANSLVRSNNLPNAIKYLESNEILNELPQKEVKLGVKLSSEVYGQYSDVYDSYLVLRSE